MLMQHLKGVNQKRNADRSRSAAAMENITAHANVNTSRTDSRAQRLIAAQEVFLEYSLVIVVLGCFMFLSLARKLIREVRASEDELYWV